MLFRKLFRTLWHYKSQFISMVLMIALGVGVFLGKSMNPPALRITASFRTKVFPNPTWRKSSPWTAWRMPRASSASTRL